MKKHAYKIILILLVLTPLWSYIYWKFSGETILKVLILDKTVATEQRNEHLSFSWVLNHSKYFKQPGLNHNPDTCYYGFYPGKNKKFSIHDLDKLTNNEIILLADSLDMAYFTDTYGVYYNEWYLDSLETEHSEKIYGGLTENDYLLLKRLKEKGKLIITEFNTLASPTSGMIRRKTEELLDVNWTGWTGRYFFSLDTTINDEIPRWVVRLYKEQYGDEWPFKKSGIVFVHESDKIVILDKDLHLEIEVPFIQTSKYAIDKFNLPDEVHYPFWFDITNCGNTNNTIAEYQIFTNPVGDSLLSVNNIPTRFPAVIEQKDNYSLYYFAGDFSDNPILMSTSYFAGIEYVISLFYNKQYSEREQFFWDFYRPMVSQIIEDHFDK